MSLDVFVCPLQDPAVQSAGSCAVFLNKYAEKTRIDSEMGINRFDFPCEVCYTIRIP